MIEFLIFVYALLCILLSLGTLALIIVVIWDVFRSGL